MGKEKVIKTTEVLKEEHKAIKVTLDVLKEICNRVEAGEIAEQSFARIRTSAYRQRR